MTPYTSFVTSLLQGGFQGEATSYLCIGVGAWILGANRGMYDGVRNIQKQTATMVKKVML